MIFFNCLVGENRYEKLNLIVRTGHSDCCNCVKKNFHVREKLLCKYCFVIVDVVVLVMVCLILTFTRFSSLPCCHFRHGGHFPFQITLDSFYYSCQELTPFRRGRYLQSCLVFYFVSSIYPRNELKLWTKVLPIFFSLFFFLHLLCFIKQSQMS